ncbi:MAG: hypothetical protein AAGI45_07350 [Cyanobacteria bacterium P01_H01_bin.26]
MSTQLEYVQQLEHKIAIAKNQLDTLKAEQKDALLAAQHEEIENLEKYLDEAHVNLKGISEAADDAWQEFKDSIEALMQNISDGLKHLIGDSDDSMGS